MSPTSRRVFTISGIVQGVGYRYFVSGVARRHQLLGYARNLADGRVEVIAEGAPEALDALRAELERGPSASRVDQVAESDTSITETFNFFNIRG